MDRRIRLRTERETELVGNIGGGVFQGGFDALKRVFGG